MLVVLLDLSLNNYPLTYDHLFLRVFTRSGQIYCRYYNDILRQLIEDSQLIISIMAWISL